MRLLWPSLAVALVSCKGDGSAPAGSPASNESTQEAQEQVVDDTPPAEDGQDAAAEPFVEADAIKVQHILIGFKDAVGFQGRAPAGAQNRTQEQAKELADSLLKRARDGEDFGALVKEFTDDSPPGIYGMTNIGKPRKQGYYPRNEMVPAFGDTGFPLRLDEIGMSEYDTKKSPYGWHIVKRIE
jgi:hypothetical protein